MASDEEGPSNGGNSSVRQQKRKGDSSGRTRGDKKHFKISPLEPDMDKCFGYIHYLIKDYAKVCVENEAKLIGIFSDPSDSSQKLKSLYMMKREQSSIQLEEDKFYGFTNYLPARDDVLVAPCTKPSVVLADKFRCFKLLKTKEDAKKEFNSRSPEDDEELPPSTVKRVKYEVPPNRTVLCLKGVIKEIKIRGYEENSYPRRVLTLIDDDSGRFLSVVLHEKHFPKGVIHLQEKEIIQLEFCKTMRSSTDEGSMNNYLMSVTGSTLKVIEDPRLNYLKDFELYTSIPIQGRVIEVEEVEQYWACPQDGCYLKGVMALGNGKYQCPTCRKTVTTDKMKKAYYAKLFITTSDGKNYEGVIFTKDIYSLKSLFRKPPSEKIFFQLMPTKLLGKNVTADYTCKPDGPNNVFNNLKVK